MVFPVNGKPLIVRGSGGIVMNDIGATSKTDPQNGILWAYRFDPGQKPQLVDRFDFGMVEPEGASWYWLHFTSAHEQTRPMIKSCRLLPEDAIESLIDLDGGLRFDVEGDTVYGALSDFERDLSGRTNETAKLFFALSKKIFVSVRRHALFSTDRVRRQFNYGQIPQSPLELLDLIFTQFAHAAAKELANLSDTLDDIEDRVLQPEINDDRILLAPIRRTSARLHRHFLAMRLSLAKFEKLQVVLPEHFDDVAMNLARELEGLDHDAVLVQDRARLLQDEMAAKTNAAINDNLRIISVLTALLMPPTLISGIFGMNVKDLPFLETQSGFWIVLGLICLSSFLAYRLLKRLDIV